MALHGLPVCNLANKSRQNILNTHHLVILPMAANEAKEGYRAGVRLVVFGLFSVSAPGNFLMVFGSVPGNFGNVFGSVPGKFLVVFRSVPGNCFRSVFRSVPGKFFEVPRGVCPVNF